MKMNYRELYSQVRYAGMATVTKMYAYALLFDDIESEHLMDIETDTLIEGLYNYYLDNKIPGLTMQQIVDSYISHAPEQRVPLVEVAHLNAQEQKDFWEKQVQRYLGNLD